MHVDPFLCDPLLARIDKRHRGGAWIFFAFVVTILILFIVNLFQGTLTVPRLGRVVLHDVQRGLGFGKPSSNAEFPLWRDVWTLSLIATIFANVYIVLRQWRVMKRLVPELETSGALRFEDRDAFSAAVDRLNQQFAEAATGRLWIYAGMLLGLLWLGLTYGVFWSLGPSSHPRGAFALNALSRWWASYETHKGGFIAYMIVAFLGCYYVYAQNWVGIRVWKMFRSSRPLIRFEADICNGDEHYGWDCARALLQSILVSVFFSALALAILSRVLLWGSPLFWMAPFVAIFFLLNPLYIFGPSIWVRPALATFKKNRIADLRVKLPDDEATLDDLRIAQIVRKEIADTAAIPSFPPLRPMRTFWILFVAGATIFVPYLLAAIAFVRK